MSYRYVFGGRTNGRNVNEIGIDAVQVYDAIGDSWSFSTPMPFTASGMGSAFADSAGNLYVFGGETTRPPPANDHYATSLGVYPQTRIFNTSSVRVHLLAYRTEFHTCV